MTAKEKADELIDKFSEYSHTDFNYSRGGYQFDSQIQNAKQCALIAVDEIINCDRFFKTLEDTKLFTDYWYKVQQEIEKL